MDTDYPADTNLLWLLHLIWSRCCSYSPSKARFCLTVPAGLSQSSMLTMREAALDAGIMPTLHSKALLLATEPEAAALLGGWDRRLYVAHADGYASTQPLNPSSHMTWLAVHLCIQ